jgi:hypothetical protein
LKSEKKVYTAPQLIKHGLVVQLTADYVPGMGHVIPDETEPPPPISAPADPGGLPKDGVPMGGVPKDGVPKDGVPMSGEPKGGGDPTSGVPKDGVPMSGEPKGGGDPTGGGGGGRRAQGRRA